MYILAQPGPILGVCIATVLFIGFVDNTIHNVFQFYNEYNEAPDVEAG